MYMYKVLVLQCFWFKTAHNAFLHAALHTSSTNTKQIKHPGAYPLLQTVYAVYDTAYLNQQMTIPSFSLINAAWLAYQSYMQLDLLEVYVAVEIVSIQAALANGNDSWHENRDENSAAMMDEITTL